MAQEVEVKIKVSTDQAVNDVNKLGDAFDNSAKDAQDAQQVFSKAGNGVQVEQSIAGLKQLKRELKNTAVGSEEFKKLYNDIDDLEDKLKSAKNTSADWVDSLEQAGGPLGMLGAGLNRAKVATQSFGGALKATGIGLIVSLLGGLVAAFSENDGAMKKLQPLMDGLKKAFQGVFRAVEPLFNTFVDLATDALPYVTKGIGMVYSAMMAYFTFLKESGGGAMKILKGVFTLDSDAISEGIDNVGGSFKKTQTSYTESMQRFSAGSKELTDKEKEELEKREENRKKALEKKEENEKKAKEKEDALAKQKIEDKKKYDEDVLKGQQDLNQATEKALLSQAEKEAKIQADAQKIIDDLTQSKETPAQKLQREFEEKKAVLELANKSTFELEMQHISDMENLDATTKEKTLASDKANSDAKIKLAQLEAEAKNNALSSYADSLNSIGGLLGESTAAGKAASVAGATISTYLAANKAYESQLVVGDPSSPFRGALAAGIAVASGLMNVKKILAVKVPNGGGGGGTPSLSAAPAAMPSFNVVGPSGANQIAGVVGGQNQQPIQAYVVAGAVTTGQSLNRNIINNASMGG
jgi:membrane protein involved in colicin uptake